MTKKKAYILYLKKKKKKTCLLYEDNNTRARTKELDMRELKSETRQNLYESLERVVDAHENGRRDLAHLVEALVLLVIIVFHPEIQFL